MQNFGGSTRRRFFFAIYEKLEGADNRPQPRAG